MTREPTILLGVGATKAGTTWLHDQLSRHPECHLRAIKELHYFDTFVQRTWERRIRQAEGAASRATGRALRDHEDWLRVLRLQRLSLGAYLGYLFEGRGTRSLVADITPSYSLLPARLLARVAQLGDTRVLYLMRDPVARLWSQVRMDAKRAATSVDEIPRLAREGLDRALRGEGAAWARSDYRAALAKLDAAVAPGRLMVGLYETLMTPEGFGRICDFAGVARRSAQFRKRVHGGVDVALPEEDRARAALALRPQYEFVARRMGELPPSWQGALAGVS